MSSESSATQQARLDLLLAADRKKQARKAEEEREARELAAEMARIDALESAERDRVRREEARQRELETLAAKRQAMAMAKGKGKETEAVRVKRKAAVLDEPVVEDLVRVIFLLGSAGCANISIDSWT
jgi:hypothetical protein